MPPQSSIPNPQSGDRAAFAAGGRKAVDRKAIGALLWLAAFCFATGIFLSATLLLRGLPPTDPVAIGRVTIERASKARDYATALLFFVIVPVATIALYRLGSRVDASLRKRLPDAGARNLASLLFVAPFFLAPFLYLTTFKWGWPLLIPLALSQLGPRVVIALHERRWLRDLLDRPLWPFHALAIVEAVSWLIARYIVTAKRIAHIPTLFLELVFLVFFIAVFWCAFVLIARLASLARELPLDVAFQRVTVAALPLVLLPPLAIRFVPGPTAIAVCAVTMLVALIVALGPPLTRPSATLSPLRRARGLDVRDAPDPSPLREGEKLPKADEGSPFAVDGRAVRNLLAFAIVPMLLYCLSYASAARLTVWLDLFHRGEALGPASDYLRGKVPYRDVFVLHGLMQDGALDAWLMELFGRNVELALARPVILGAFAVPALWLLAMVIFDSLPLAALVVLFGAVTTTDNERVLFEVAVLALVLAGVQRARKLPFVFAGIFAALGLFFSFEIGLYSIGGALFFLGILAVLRRPGMLRAIVLFVVGLAIGAAPFVVYLASRDALGAFLETSFITLPRIIDAIWSLPFPDLTHTFRRDLNLHTISDFLLREPFRFVLNPLVIGIALLCLIQRALQRRSGPLDVSLLALTTFALITQRSALGRADFPHQYFSAFLIGPLIVLLLVLFAEGAATLWRTRDRAAQAFLILVVCALFPIFFVALWVPDIVNARLDDVRRYLPRVTRIGYDDPRERDIRERIDLVRYWITELSPKGSPIFDFSNQPSYYFYCDRPNPTRFYQVPILSPRELQREAILALEKAKPPIVLRRSPEEFDVFDGVDNSIRAQAVAAYIDAHYRYDVTARGTEIWVRKSTPQPFELESYLRQIRVPTVTELAVVGARSRLIFPTIGSLPGANDTYWRSDLVLHNPLREPMALQLRYVVPGSDQKIDRRVTLRGGQSIVWPDVVKTLFRAPDGRGVLWIDYRGARGPVARVKTYDVKHAGKASLETALSMRDAATSSSAINDLAIVGLPGGGLARRINLGVVNIGAYPATFRITVTARDGKQVGGTIEEGLPEDMVALFNDVEPRLGVQLDETMTVHVTMVGGTGIAYASVISAEGDNQFIPAVPSPTP